MVIALSLVQLGPNAIFLWEKGSTKRHAQGRILANFQLPLTMKFTVAESIYLGRYVAHKSVLLLKLSKFAKILTNNKRV